MSRRKFFDTDKLKDIYNACYKVLNGIRGDEQGGYLLGPELSVLTGYKQSQISKALQWGRRKFEDGEISVMQWIMASPKGYFLPESMDDPRVFAYSIQNILTIKSMTKTQLPLYQHLLETRPEELRAAYRKSSGNKEDISTEMNPWAVFNAIMENDYFIPIAEREEDFDYE